MTEKTQHVVLEGRYVLLACLGSGDTAEVYRASDRLLGREVALKILRAEYAEDSGCVQRFRDEARSAASLAHPNLVQIYELGSSDKDRPFFTMEYAGGGTLKDRLNGSGALHPASAAAMAAEIGRALQAAHARAIIHRDIKPQNVLLTSSGRVKVADFGIACTPFSTTDARGIPGTARYMSPEQAAGKTVGESSDLYSLGVVLYEMLTGEPPFRDGAQAAIALKHINEPPLPPKELNSSVPDALNELTLRLLAKSTAERPADAGALVAELEAAIEATPVLEARSAPKPSKPPHIYRAGSRLLSVISEGIKGSSPVRKRPPPANAIRLKDRRARRRRFLSTISLVALLIAGGWGLYGDELSTIYADAGPQNTGVSTEASSSAASSAEEASPARALVHSANTGNISTNSTYLDIPTANDNPDASITITQNWNPGGDGARGGVYNDHPVGVWYDADRERWAIFNQDRAPMPEGASFNVVVYSDAAKTA